MSEPSSEAPKSDCGEADEWLSASETHRRIRNIIRSRSASVAIAQRAHTGELRAKAVLFITGRTSQRDAEIPKEFWWAGGHQALTQNWDTGDFETWIDQKLHLRALGVSFHLGDLRKYFPNVFDARSKIAVSADSKIAASTETEAGLAGRLPARWWDDLWIEICRSLYVGDLKPTKQADIEKAMNDWIASTGNSAATSTIRARARKLWQAISREDEN
jgi:hypothetical protein